MENDYTHLENLIQDVTSLDNARMTLRWALERLSSLGKSHRETEDNLRAAQDARLAAEKRLRDVEATVSERMKLISEQEGFYKKLEQTVALLSEGKVDLTTIARKEADLDKARQEVAQSWQKQFEELERQHREMTTRWTARLEQAESFAPEKLSEALARFDGYRRQIDEQHQERLLHLETSFRMKEETFLQREKELLVREQQLEGAFDAKKRELLELRVQLEASVEDRVRALEAAAAARHAETQRERDERLAALERGIEERHKRLAVEEEELRRRLHGEYQTRMEAWQGEHKRLAADIERELELERASRFKEKTFLEETLKGARERIWELEGLLSSQDSKRQEDVLQWLSQAQADFDRRVQALDEMRRQTMAAIDERERALEGEAAVRQKAVQADAQARLEEARREWEGLVKGLEGAWRGEREWLCGQVEQGQGALEQTRCQLADMRRALVDATTRSMTEMDSVHQRLTEEFRKLWTTREGGEDSMIQALEGQNAILRKLAESIGEKQKEIEELQRSLAKSSYEVVKAQIMEEHQKQVQDLETGLTSRIQLDFDRRLEDERREQDRRSQAKEAEVRAEEAAKRADLEARLREEAARALAAQEEEFAAVKSDLLAAYEVLQQRIAGRRL